MTHKSRDGAADRALVAKGLITALHAATTRALHLFVVTALQFVDRRI
jgi:hypothetical protein